MKTIYLLILTVLTVVSLQAQQDPYAHINKILDDKPVEINTLWPFEDTNTRVSDPKVDYSLPISSASESKFEINFSDIKEMKSAVYDYTNLSQNALITAFKNSIPTDYNLEFEQSGEEGSFLFYSNEKEKEQKIYFLAAGENQAELLFFELKKNKGKQLKLNIKSIIDQSNPTNHEKNVLHGTATGNQ